MKKEPKKKYTSSELYHAWANGLIKEETKGGVFKANETELYYNDSLVAKTYKNFVFIKEFSVRGAYRSGYSSYNINSAFNNSKKVIFIYDIPTQVDNISLEWLRGYFFKEISKELNKVAYLDEIMKNKRLTAITTNNLPNFSGIELVDRELKSLCNKKYQEFLRIEYTFGATKTIYEGWGRTRGTFRKELKFRPIDLLRKKENLFVTQEVRDEINFRDWRYNNTKIDSTVFSSKNRYARRETTTSCFLYDYQKSKEIYLDVEQKAKVLEQIKATNEHFAKRQQEKRDKENAERALANYNKIKEFRDQAIKLTHSYFNSVNFLYPILSLTSDNRVKTSLGVTITVKEAKKAFKFFKYHIDNGIMFVDVFTPAYNHTTIEGFKIISVQKESYNAYNKGEILQIIKKNDWVMTIGCHKIPYEEVIEFLTYYKLDWNENKI